MRGNESASAVIFSREAANERRLEPNVVSISPRVEAVYSELRSLLIHLDANGGVHEDEDASGCQLEPINAGLRDAREGKPTSDAHPQLPLVAGCSTAQRC